MGRRGDHSREELKTMAIEAAEKIVSQSGMPGLTARKIAAMIGYTVGSLYIVFKNLDDLTLHVNGRTFDRMQAFLQDAIANEADPRVCITKLGHAYIEFANAHTGLWRMIFEHRQADDEPAPQWYHEKINTIFSMVEKSLAALNPDKNSDAINLQSRAIWGGVHGICILSLTGKLDIAGGAADTLTEHLISTYLNGCTNG